VATAMVASPHVATPMVASPHGGKSPHVLRERRVRAVLGRDVAGHGDGAGSDKAASPLDFHLSFRTQHPAVDL